MEVVARLPQQQLQVVRDVSARTVGESVGAETVAIAIDCSHGNKAHRPARSTLRIACGIEKPSKTGTACVTPSPESSTIPVVRPEA